jgi:hypothetical protein
VDDQEAVERVFQLACLRFVAAKRKHGAKAGEEFFGLATAIEDAFPDVIAAYRTRIGIEQRGETPAT